MKTIAAIIALACLLLAGCGAHHSATSGDIAANSYTVPNVTSPPSSTTPTTAWLTDLQADSTKLATLLSAYDKTRVGLNVVEVPNSTLAVCDEGLAEMPSFRLVLTKMPVLVSAPWAQVLSDLESAFNFCIQGDGISMNTEIGLANNQESITQSAMVTAVEHPTP